MNRVYIITGTKPGTKPGTKLSQKAYTIKEAEDALDYAENNGYTNLTITVIPDLRPANKPIPTLPSVAREATLP
jgi:hypothetical protein